MLTARDELSHLADTLTEEDAGRVLATVQRHCPDLYDCEYCGGQKVSGPTCPGCDQCIYGPDGGPALACAGWGKYCCKCGADYARSQL